MGTFILRRLILLIPVMLIVGIVVFTLIHLTPGDPAAVILGPDATPEQVDQLRERLGLNEPFHIQFIDWFTNAMMLDFGDSLFIGEPVTQALRDRAQPTGLLTLYALTLSILIGIPAGVIAASMRNSGTPKSWRDRGRPAQLISRPISDGDIDQRCGRSHLLSGNLVDSAVRGTTALAAVWWVCRD